MPRYMQNAHPSGDRFLNGLGAIWDRLKGRKLEENWSRMVHFRMLASMYVSSCYWKCLVIVLYWCRLCENDICDSNLYAVSRLFDRAVMGDCSGKCWGWFQTRFWELCKQSSAIVPKLDSETVFSFYNFFRDSFQFIFRGWFGSDLGHMFDHLGDQRPRKQRWTKKQTHFLKDTQESPPHVGNRFFGPLKETFQIGVWQTRPAFANSTSCLRGHGWGLLFVIITIINMVIINYEFIITIVIIIIVIVIAITDYY